MTMKNIKRKLSLTGFKNTKNLKKSYKKSVNLIYLNLVSEKDSVLNRIKVYEKKLKE